MDRPDLPLNALRVFEVAVRQGSFTRAAIELRVTQAAVSHQIARLEDALGTVLFRRTSGGLVPTAEGAALFPVLERSFDNLARALDRMKGKHHIEVLHVGVVTTFALGWLIPRIDTFRNAHPEIDLRISTNNNRVEILREGLDMAIRFGSGQWTGLESEHLMSAPLSPLCSPEIAARLHAPEDLSGETLLRSYRRDEWAQWFQATGRTCPGLTGLVLDSSIALAELAADGAGVALLPVSMFRRQVDAGRLVQPYREMVSTGSYYLTRPMGKLAPSSMPAFEEWLRSEVQEQGSP